MKNIIAVLVITMLTTIGFAQDAATTTAVQAEPGTRAYRESKAQLFFDFTRVNDEADALKLNFGNNLTETLSEADRKSIPEITYELKNWRTIPQESIRYPYILEESLVKNVEVQSGKYAGEYVMGVKLKFPPYGFDMFVDIIPPFSAPSGDSDDNSANEAFIEFGLVKNVGLVRSAYLEVFGLQQPEKIYLITENSSGEEFQYTFGSLDFVGWRMLEWVNPNYIEDITDRSIEVLPLYPQLSSIRRLKSIKIHRSALSKTVDFVTYIRNIKLTFDKAIDEEVLADFAHEDTWHILKKSVTRKEELLRSRTLTDRYFEYLESRKKYDYSPPKSGNVTGGQ